MSMCQTDVKFVTGSWSVVILILSIARILNSGLILRAMKASRSGALHRGLAPHIILCSKATRASAKQLRTRNRRESQSSRTHLPRPGRHVGPGVLVRVVWPASGCPSVHRDLVHCPFRPAVRPAAATRLHLSRSVPSICPPRHRRGSAFWRCHRRRPAPTPRT